MKYHDSAPITVTPQKVYHILRCFGIPVAKAIRASRDIKQITCIE